VSLRAGAAGEDGRHLVGLPRLIALGIAAALLLAASIAWSAEPLRNCGSGVRAAVVDCGKAKRLAREWKKTHAKSVWLYTCAPSEKRVRCVLDRKIISFPAD
jgi:hypothetical protein